MADLLASNLATINFILIDVALALSIYVTLACGLLSLANAGFMAIGAYTAAIVATQTSLPLATGFALAALLALVVALPFGLVVLRLRALYLAIATLGFGEIVRLLALNGDKILALIVGGHPIVFNGGEGITLPYHTPAVVLGLPETTWPILLYVAVTTYVVATLHRSHDGRVVAAIRLDETAASSLGVDVVRYKLLAFALGAAIAAGAGALSTPIIRVIDPGNYTFNRAVSILASTVLGGMTHWVGPIVGAIVLTALPETLRSLKDQRDVVNGVIIMLSIIYLPRGLADPLFWRGVWQRWTRRSAPGSREKGADDAAPGTAPEDAAPADDRRLPRGAGAGLLPLADSPREGEAPRVGASLVVDAVSRSFGGVVAVEKVSFRVAPGTICGLIGPNGAGKTTLLNVISGLLPPSVGSVQVDGQPIERCRAPHEVAAHGVARTFQNIRLFGDLSVLENVLLGYHLRRQAGLLATLLRLPPGWREDQAWRRDAQRLLHRLGLARLADVDAGTLSYGDQRRVELARALAREPRLLLLDEPTAGMNPTETDRLADVLLELRQAGLTLLVVEHDLDLIARVSDTVVVLNFGRKIAEGPLEAVRADPGVIEAYLGSDE